MMLILTQSLLAAGLVLISTALAVEATPSRSPVGTAVEFTASDKSRYTLWHRTPPELLREMEGLCRSPHTVDAGWAQIETYILGYAYDCSTIDGGRSETWRVAATTLKLGILHNLDLEFEFAPYTSIRTKGRAAGSVVTQQGFGDITPKAKLNLWGNDGGRTALALLPFVKIPTNQDSLGNDAVEGGLTVPMAVGLPWGWWLGLSPEVAFLQDGLRGGYSPAFANTSYCWHRIAGELSGYIEFTSWVSFEQGSRWVGTVNFGLTYLLMKNAQLDAGVLVGVTRAAPDLNPFLGASFRF